MQLESAPKTKLRVTGQHRAARDQRDADLQPKVASIATQAAELAEVRRLGRSHGQQQQRRRLRDGLRRCLDRPASASPSTASPRPRAGLGTAHPAGDRHADRRRRAHQARDGRAEHCRPATARCQAVAAAVDKTTGVRATMVRVGTDVDGHPHLPAHAHLHRDRRLLGFSVDPTGAGQQHAVPRDRPADGRQRRQHHHRRPDPPITSATNTFTDLMPGRGRHADDAAPPVRRRQRWQSTPQSMSDKVKALVDAINAAITEAGTPHELQRDQQDRGPARRQRHGAWRGGAAAGHRHRRRRRHVVGLPGHPERPRAASWSSTRQVQPRRTPPTRPVPPARFTDPKDPAAPGAVVGARLQARDLAKSLQRQHRRYGDHGDQGPHLARSTASRRTSSPGTSGSSLRTAALERQYGALEVALGKLQSQSSWLAGQINSLPTMSSGARR